MKWLALAACTLVACGDNAAATFDADPQCVPPAPNAGSLSGLVTGVVTQLAQAPRATASERDTTRTELAMQLTTAGWTPMLETYPTGANVYATIPATITTTRQIIVGAHFDTVTGSPGANDNGTGVAAVIGVAHYLHDVPCRGATVTIMLFDEEEQGLFGSRAYANVLSAQGANVIAVHTVDQIGWDSDGDRRFELELPTAALETEYRAAAGLLGIPVTPTTTSGTDHQSFRSAGFPSVGITEEYVGGDTSPYRHTPQDTAATVDLSYLVLGTQLVARVVAAELAP
ncbi:MAG: hypothetical protein JWO36_3701 [Myxococcales bacterium]|nr:hypothetical protein [Myxococcales bacterium]